MDLRYSKAYMRERLADAENRRVATRVSGPPSTTGVWASLWTATLGVFAGSGVATTGSGLGVEACCTS